VQKNKVQSQSINTSQIVDLSAVNDKASVRSEDVNGTPIRGGHYLPLLPKARETKDKIG